MSDGLVKNSSRLNQPLLFQGVNYQAITPTDIDAFLDFRNRLFIFVEVKGGGKQIDTGQRIAIERLVNSSHLPPDRRSIAFHCQHSVDVGPVYLKDTVVKSYYYAGRWKQTDVNFLDAVDMMVKKHVPDLDFSRQKEQEVKLPQSEADWGQCPF